MSDACGLVEIVHNRLRMLCAPAQDADLEQMRASCLAQPTVGKVLATLLEGSDAILGDIEEMNRQIKERLRVMDAQQQASEADLSA